MKYVARPVVVDAFEIIDMDSVSTEQGRGLKLDDGREVIADKGMTARYTPKVGDYWVVQEDGYIYLNPKAVFERKYARADAGNVERDKASAAS